MQRTHPAGVPRNQENVKIVMKCPCVGNSNYARRNDRPALANIQSGAAQRQYLTVDYGQQKTAPCRSKSVSGCSQVGPSRKPSPAFRQAPCAESTKIRPSHLAPMKPESGRSKSVSGCTQVGSSARPSSGFRQAPCAESTKIKPSHLTPTVKLPVVAMTGNLKPTNKQLASLEEPLIVASRRSTGGCGCSARRASSTSGALKDDVFASTRSASQTRASVASSTHLKLSQVQIDACRKIAIAKSTEILTSTTPKVGCCVTVRPKSAKDSTCFQSQQFVTITQDSSSTSSTTHYSSACMTVKRNYVTLGDQQFVTLSQDTLKTTRCSVDSALANIRFTRDSSILDENERTFVDARGFFDDLDNGMTSTVKTIPVRSPLDFNVPPRRSNNNNSSDAAEGGTVKKPAVKTTLKKRSSINPQPLFPLLYSPEYSNDLISYCYSHKRNLLLKSEWVEMYVDKRARSDTVNWLLQVSGFVATQFEPVYYMSVRVFDYSVITLRLRHGHYQLAAAVAFWIALKYLDNPVRLKVSKIFSLCNGKYSKIEILSMERKILKGANFCLNIPDPLDFLYNYLRSSSLEDDEVLKYGAKFALECATLFETYALVEAPFIAATALYMAYQILRKTKEVYINFIWYDKKVIHQYVERILRVKIRYAIMEKYEPFNTYGGSEKMHVAKMFSNF